MIPTARIWMCGLLVALFSVGVAPSPRAQGDLRLSNEDQCLQELQKTYAVDTVSRITQRKSRNRRWVRAWATQEDGTRVLFRCQMRYGELRGIDTYSGGDWAEAEPQTRAEELDPDTALVFTGEAASRREGQGAEEITPETALDTSGEDDAGVDASGLDGAGEDRAGIDQSGRDAAGADQSGVEGPGEEDGEDTGLAEDDAEAEDDEPELAVPRFIRVE